VSPHFRELEPTRRVVETAGRRFKSRRDGVGFVVGATDAVTGADIINENVSCTYGHGTSANDRPESAFRGLRRWTRPRGSAVSPPWQSKTRRVAVLETIVVVGLMLQSSSAADAQGTLSTSADPRDPSLDRIRARLAERAAHHGAAKHATFHDARE